MYGTINPLFGTPSMGVVSLAPTFSVIFPFCVRLCDKIFIVVTVMGFKPDVSFVDVLAPNHYCYICISTYLLLRAYLLYRLTKEKLIP